MASEEGESAAATRGGEEGGDGNADKNAQGETSNGTTGGGSDGDNAGSKGEKEAAGGRESSLSAAGGDTDKSRSPVSAEARRGSAKLTPLRSLRAGGLRKQEDVEEPPASGLTVLCDEAMTCLALFEHNMGFFANWKDELLLHKLPSNMLMKLTVVVSRVWRSKIDLSTLLVNLFTKIKAQAEDLENGDKLQEELRQVTKERDELKTKCEQYEEMLRHDDMDDEYEDDQMSEPVMIPETPVTRLQQSEVAVSGQYQQPGVDRGTSPGYPPGVSVSPTGPLKVPQELVKKSPTPTQALLKASTEADAKESQDSVAALKPRRKSRRVSTMGNDPMKNSPLIAEFLNKDLTKELLGSFIKNAPKNANTFFTIQDVIELTIVHAKQLKMVADSYVQKIHELQAQIDEMRKLIEARRKAAKKATINQMSAEKYAEGFLHRLEMWVNERVKKHNELSKQVKGEVADSLEASLDIHRRLDKSRKSKLSDSKCLPAIFMPLPDLIKNETVGEYLGITSPSSTRKAKALPKPPAGKGTASQVIPPTLIGSDEDPFKPIEGLEQAMPEDMKMHILNMYARVMESPKRVQATTNKPPE